eukprot:1826442-Rhodomonas_salina.1
MREDLLMLGVMASEGLGGAKAPALADSCLRAVAKVPSASRSCSCMIDLSVTLTFLVGGEGGERDCHVPLGQ